MISKPAIYRPGVREQQLVRMDGSVLISFYVAPGMAAPWLPYWMPAIWGPCAGRVRVLPDGPWLVLAYFPGGFPGPTAPFPVDQELPGQIAIEGAT
jgi:hypothetical protein